jgi:hypothetical protein
MDGSCTRPAFCFLLYELTVRVGRVTALQISANNGHATSTDILIVPSKLAGVLDYLAD